MARHDLLVIGGGILGLATAYRLLQSRPRLSLAVVEKEREPAMHQTGHNSGVLHAGLYYAPGSQKARLCREGKAELERFAREHEIPFEHRGKLIVALTEEERPRLATLRQRGEANGVEGLCEVGPERMREIEPHAAGLRALWSPTTGVIDFRRVALALADEVRARGGTVYTSRELVGIQNRGSEHILQTTAGDVACSHFLACAGLQSDRVAAMSGAGGPERIIPFRGDYYTFRPEARHLVRGLIYPVPDTRFPFLGAHLTRTIDGDVLAGPNAVLAFAREGYRRTDVSWRDLAETITFAGFRRLARRYWRTGLAEMWRDFSKAAFVRELARYVPALGAKDVVFGPSGVRAQALGADGALVDDFSIRESAHALHVVNAPSPAATASLAIARGLAERAIEKFGLG